MNVNKKFILKLFFGLVCLAILVPVITSAQEVTVRNPIGYNDFESLLYAIADGISLLIGALGVIMIIWSGFLFLTSAGDPGRLGKAKVSLAYAVAGIAIGLAAHGIIELIKKIISTT